MRPSSSLRIGIVALIVLLGAREARAQPVQQPDTTATSLLDAERVAVYLHLDSSQTERVSALISQILEIMAHDAETIAAMRARFRSGDKPGLFEKLKMRGQRNDRIERIETLVTNIKDVLTPEQRARSSVLVVPVLPQLSPKSFESD